MAKALRYSIGIFLGLFAAAASIAAPAPLPRGVERTAPWNSETSDMEADTRVIYGRLANGLRYAIRPNTRPENQIQLRMVVDFGSAAEADTEQGLAHFIEHMAFNGSTHVPEGEMVRTLERLGLSFGADTNASTGFLQTSYMLDLPRTDSALFERALFLMRETASEITFKPDALDRERGVVLSEMRDGENVQFRRTRDSFNLFYPNSFYAKRFPIGQKHVLETASVDTISALYKRWYVPDRTRIIVVGPVDPAKIEREIARRFGDWGGTGADLGKLKTCTFNPDRPAKAAMFIAPDLDELVQVEQIVPDQLRADSLNNALLMVRMQIGWGVIANRLARKSRNEDTPFLYANPSFEPGFCQKYARIGFSTGGKDGSWPIVLPMVEQAIRQAVQYGFSDDEIAEQIKRMDASYSNAVNGEATSHSGNFTNELVNLEDNILSSAAYRQLAWLQLKPFLTTRDVHSEFAHWFQKLDRPQIFLSSRKADGVTSDQLLTAFNDSRATAVSAPVDRGAVSWGYSDFGVPGTVVEDNRIADLGIRTVRFANGVLLNLKRTDFEADQIYWTMLIDGGQMVVPNDKLAALALMRGAYVGGGLGKHDVDDLRKILAGSTARPVIGYNDEQFGGSGNVVAKDLETQLQLLSAYLTDPGYREEAVRLYRRPLPENYARLNATPDSALNQGQSHVLYADDPRFNIVPLDKALAADFAGLRDTLGDSLLRNRMEVGIVGDIDEAKVIALVARTLGALPERKAVSVIDPKARAMQFSQSIGTHDFHHRGEADQMAWKRIWPTTDSKDQKLALTMSLLSDIVRIRLLDEIREKLGAAYGAGAASVMWDGYPGRGYFQISTNGDPKDVGRIEAAVDSVIAEIVAAPVAGDLFERGRKPTLEGFTDWRKRNGTWMEFVSEAQTAPDKMARYRNKEALYRSITADDIWKAAQRFLKDKPSYIFRAIPEPEKVTDSPAEK